MTCIIAAYGSDGCAIIADTRVMREYTASNQSKFHLPWDKVAIAGSGTGALLDKLAEGVSALEVPRRPDFEGVKTEAEDMLKAIRDRYRERISREFKLDAVLMGLDGFDKGEPKLALVHSAGIAERVEGFTIIGHGGPYTAPMFKLLYDSHLTCEELAVLGWFSIAETILLGIDQTVGMTEVGPECVILRKDSRPTFLNTLDHQFAPARAALSNLAFRLKLVTSIWEKVPIPYEGFLLEGNLPDPKLEALKAQEMMHRMAIDGFDVFACASCSKRSFHPTRWRKQVKNCPYCGSKKVKHERSAIIPMH